MTIMRYTHAGKYCKLTYYIQCKLKVLIVCGWLCMCIKLSANHISAYVPSHTEEIVSGTADSKGVETTPKMVSHFVLIALHAVNK